MGTGIVSPWHIAILVLVILLVFGPKKLPEMGRSLGRGIRELKDGFAHDEHLDVTEPKPAATALPPRDLRDRDTI